MNSLIKKNKKESPLSKGSSKTEPHKKFEKCTLLFLDHLKSSIEEEDSICNPIVNGFGEPVVSVSKEYDIRYFENITEAGEEEQMPEEEEEQEYKNVFLEVDWTFEDKEQPPMAQQISLVEQRDLDKGMICSIARAVQFFSPVCVLRLQGCKLTTSLFLVLARALSISRFVNELDIRWNRMSEVAANALAGAKTGLEYLTINGCHLNDEAAKWIAKAIQWQSAPDKEPSRLLSLNLNCNSIGCEGARHLAAALRTNRTLCALSIADNDIWNEGAIALTTALNKFTLTFEEIKDRMRRYFILYGKYHKHFLNNEKEQKRDEFYDPHPFFELSETDYDLICAGNDQLQYLNLSHNYFSIEAYRQFLELVKYQIQAALPLQKGLLYLELAGVENSTQCKDINMEIQKLLKYRMDNL